MNVSPHSKKVRVYNLKVIQILDLYKEYKVQEIKGFKYFKTLSKIQSS